MNWVVMVKKGWLVIPLALAVLAGAWFGVGAFLRAEQPELGPAVVITPSDPAPGEPSPSPSDSPSTPEPSPSPSDSPSTPEPSPSRTTPEEANTVAPPVPKPAGDCDPDDDPDDEDWCGPGYGDEDD